MGARSYPAAERPAGASALRVLLSTTIVVVGDLILAEVLQGFRNDSDYHTAKNLLLDLDLHALVGVEIAQKAAENFRVLRKKGIAVRKTIDCLIATYCIEHGITLLYSDRDFDPFVEHLRLKPVLRF